MFEYLIRRMYLLYGSILLIIPAVLTSLWFVAQSNAGERPKEAFIAFFPAVFSRFELTWYISTILSALPFFFGVRLLQGEKKLTKSCGIVLMCLSLFFIIVSLYVLNAF